VHYTRGLRCQQGRVANIFQSAAPGRSARSLD